MKKIVCMLLVVILLGAAALAETVNYADPEEEIAFAYDTDDFKIEMDDVGDDEHLVILGGVRENWGSYSIRIHLRELEDGEAFPEKADFAETEAALDTSVDQGEWNGFEDVFMYSVADEQYFEQVFIAPVADDDGEIDGILTINVRVEKTDDEETGMNRDDAISAVLDTLELLDD